ncbi:hypothetical protein ACWD3I_25575 [Streptomyces sp. NPDC002817]
MTPTPRAGSIAVAGKTVSLLGFDTMRLTGSGTRGTPDDCTHTERTGGRR